MNDSANKNRFLRSLKKKGYLIFPIVCLIFWGFYYFIKIRTFISYNRYWDFGIFYEIGKQVIIDPTKLYENPNFFYTPNISLFFALTIALFPVYISYYLWYILNIFVGIILVLEFDKVLTILDLRNKMWRFILLLYVSNGWFLHSIFTFSQTKLIVGLLFVLVLKRELLIKESEKPRDWKFLLINYNLLIFAVGMAPFLSLLVLIYFFYDIQLESKMFVKKNFQKLGLMIALFFFQNFLFIIHPLLIIEFIGGFGWGLSHQYISNCFLITLVLPSSFSDYYSLIATIILIILTIGIALNKKLNLERKIGYFAFSYFYFGMFSGYQTLHILLIFSLFLYIPYINQKEGFFNLIKNNKIIILSLLSLAGISLVPHILTIKKYIPITTTYPLSVFVALRYVFLFTTFGIALSILLMISLELRVYYIIFIIFIIFLVLINIYLFNLLL